MTMVMGPLGQVCANAGNANVASRMTQGQGKRGMERRMINGRGSKSARKDTSNEQMSVVRCLIIRLIRLRNAPP
jgi:hypothetical protein